MRRSESAAGRRWSKKILVGTTTLGVIALGTGMSLASTQNSTKAADSVTCIVQADAKAAADANSALSDVFSVGTKLHFSSAGRAVDVTVSAPLTAAAPPANNNGQQNNGKNDNGKKNNGKKNNKKKNQNKKNQNKNKNNGKKNQNKRNNQTKAATVSAPAVNTAKAVTVKAAKVDPNSVCADLSKDAFNTLGDVVDGNNVGAFLATMTPVANNGRKNNGQKK